MISIFTPTHDSSFLPQIYDSLKAQTDSNWEWVIGYNNGAQVIEFNDARVKPFVIDCAPEWVGPLKAFCCEKATGEILLELDHDDLLMPTAVEEVRRAFADNPACGFAYSNTIHATGEFQPVQRFDPIYGWKYREIEWQGHKLDEHISFDPTPDSISRIWFAPNHLRAFRTELYHRVGGYNKKMRILDDLDLMCKMYCESDFIHIDKGLYIYRVHGANTWLRFNEEIQQNVYRMHDQYAPKLAEAWADRRGLRKVELGGRLFATEGYETLDLKDAQIIADLDKPWPFEDSSVGVIRAFDVFEHLKDPLFTMKELHRVLAPGGWAFLQIPSTDGRGAFQDPTHKSFWNENSFLYYTNAQYAQYIDTPVRFQAPRLYTTEMSPRHVCWVQAHLVCLKEGYRPAGLIEI